MSDARRLFVPSVYEEGFDHVEPSIWSFLTTDFQKPTFFRAGVDGAVKLWTPNVNFEDPANWDTGHVPTFEDTAVFQADTAVPIVIPSAGVSVCQMILPATGQLIFESYTDIIAESSADTCTGQSESARKILIKNN